MKKDELYLGHIFDACAQIKKYIFNIDHPTFIEDRKTQDAVVRQLEIIGEASRRISETFKENHSEIPWHAIIGMRNRIAHDYLNIDIQVVWEVAINDIPVLEEFVRPWS